MSYVNAYTKHLKNHKSWIRKDPGHKGETSNAGSLIDAYERSKKYERNYNRRNKQSIKRKSIKSNIYKPTVASNSKINQQTSYNSMHSIDDFKPANETRYQEYKRQKNTDFYKKHKYKLQIREINKATNQPIADHKPKVHKGLNSARQSKEGTNKMSSLPTHIKTPRTHVKKPNPLYKYDNYTPTSEVEEATTRKESLAPWPVERTASGRGSESGNIRSYDSLSHIGEEDHDGQVDEEAQLEKYKHQSVATFLQNIKRQKKKKKKGKKPSKHDRLRDKFKAIILNMLKVQSRRNRRPVQEELMATFRAFDSDNDGQICAEDLYRGMQVLGKVMPLKEIKALIRAVDQDGNATLDYGEYLAIILADEAEMSAAFQASLETNEQETSATSPTSPVIQSGKPMNDSLIQSLQQQINFLMDKNNDLKKVNGLYKSEMDELKKEISHMKNRTLSTPRSVSRGSSADIDHNLLSPYQRSSIDNHNQMVPMSDSPTPRHHNSLSKQRTLFKRFVKKKKRTKKKHDSKDTVFSLTAVKRKSVTSSDSEPLNAFQQQYKTINDKSSARYKEGCQFYLEGSHYDAKKCFNQVVDILSTKKYDEHFQKRLAKSLHNLGLIQYAAKAYGEAIDLYKRAVQTFESFHLESERAKCLTNLGLAYYRNESNQEALNATKLAHTLYENVLQNEEKDHAQTLLNITFIVRHQQNTHKLLKYSLLALAQYEKLNDKKYIMYFNRIVGDTYLLLFKYDDARPYFVRGVKYFDKTDENEMIGHFKKGLGIVERMSGRMKVSLKCFKQALNAYEICSHKKGQITCHYNLGHLFHLRDEFLHASEHFSRGVTLIENQLGVQKIKAENNLYVNPHESKHLHKALLFCHYFLALNYHEEELFDDAMEHYQKAIDLYDESIAPLFNLESMSKLIESMRLWHLMQSSSTGGGGSNELPSKEDASSSNVLSKAPKQKPTFSRALVLHVGHCYHNLGSIQYARSMVMDSIDSLTIARGIYVHVVDELQANQSCLKKLSLAYKAAGREDDFLLKFVER